MMTRRISAPALVLCAIALGLATASPAAAGSDDKKVAVAIKEYAFSPAAITVPKGTTVVWTNNDETPHNVTTSGKQFKSPPLDTGDSFSWTFSQAGSFTYFCQLHPQMTGKIEVVP